MHLLLPVLASATWIGKVSLRACLKTHQFFASRTNINRIMAR
jgi:hypothetical protein